MRPRRAPAIEYDLEKVRSTSTFGCFASFGMNDAARPAGDLPSLAVA